VLSSILLLGIVIRALSPVQDTDITGVWRDDRGREYRIRQVGAAVYWSMDARPEAVNAFRGTLVGNRLSGLWADLPGGQGKTLGNLELRIVDANLMLKVGGTAKYDAEIWRRVVATGEPPSPLSSPSPSPGRSPPAQPGTSVPGAKEDDAPARIVSLSWAQLAQGGAIVMEDGASLVASAVPGDGSIALMTLEPATPIQGALTPLYSIAATQVPEPGASRAARISIPVPISVTGVAAYGVAGGTLFAVPHSLREGRVEIETARVRVLPPEFRASLRDGGALDPPPGGMEGYVLAKSGQADDDNRCVEGARGETYQAPGHAFTIRFEVTAGCELAAQISSWLQEALVHFRGRFVDPRGNPARSDLTPQNRMEVLLRGPRGMGGVNAEYQSKFSWTGLMLVNAAAAADNPEVTRDVMFHELFHAIQDEWANLLTGQFLGAWWFEASAEWAGYQARKAKFGDIVYGTLERYTFFLSVPVESSTGFESGNNYAYGMAPLIDFVETRSPYYVQRALRRGNARSSVRYLQLVESGGLRETFPLYVKDVLRAADATDRSPAVTGQAVIGQKSIGVTTYPQAVLTGGAEATVERRTDADARKRPIVFPVAEAAPLTARVYVIFTQALDQPINARVRVDADGVGPPLEVLAGGADLNTMTDETVFNGLGQSLKSLRVVVINSDPDRAARFHVTVKLEESEPVGPAYRLVNARVTASAPDRPCIRRSATEAETSCGTGGDRYSYVLETSPPRTIVPGVPFTVRVRLQATASASGRGIDHDVALLLADAPSSTVQIRPTPSHQPTVGYITREGTGGRQEFVAPGLGEWEVTVDPGNPPPKLRLRLLIRWGMSFEGYSEEWLAFEYGR
jgi:hypothetical protein